ncbi:UPF0711 protein C18orf21 homolog isoform X1 [Cynoglossus semilaevis]|uniref:UPF0711 protein C18orf21 homolog isoform X1 n=1 Tax=Cynoglossus semilaevis TaxID=244447 RepID=UPI000D6271F6|nr:UPF0711 protein C18orf21 homolog isoform X1 [Cynoglossus semilaevis]
MSPACSHTSLLRTSKYGPSHRLVELPPVRQCIGQSSLQPHPYVKMGGSAGGLSLYKAGCLGSCSKHLTHDHSHRRAEAFGPSTAVAAASASKPNSPALCSPHLSESEMATFVSMATCHACNKTSRHRGMDRDFIAALAKTHSTPRSGGKHKTPPSTSRPNMSTPKTPAKDKTPVHTPRSSSSSNTPGSGSSSTKSASKPKNWVVQRLSKILMKEDTKGNKKGGLKDFLSSL